MLVLIQITITEAKKIMKYRKNVLKHVTIISERRLFTKMYVSNIINQSQHEPLQNGTYFKPMSMVRH